MRNYLTIIVCLVFFYTSMAQGDSEILAVRKPIDQLFTGMNKGDSALVSGAFEKMATMATIMKDKSGNPIIRYESSIQKFLTAVASPHEEILSEPIWDLKMNVDGHFAQAWANYAFYVGKKFSHCGVDAFELFKGEDGKWRIFHLADTRQKEGCTIPPHISNQFN